MSYAQGGGDRKYIKKVNNLCKMQKQIANFQLFAFRISGLQILIRSDAQEGCEKARSKYKNTK